MNVTILRLSGGETVISQIKEEKNDGKEEFLVLEHPLIIQVIPAEMMGGQQGQTLLHFVPFVVGSKESNIWLKKSAIVTEAEPDEQIVEQYNKLANPSPIEQPDKRLVAPQ